tara:strand:- start:552 stop:1220 length:669 start_codon:yes stop_codon:yes gene_type:complete
LTAANTNLGDFIGGGEGFADNDAGVVGKDGLSGIITINSADTDADTSFIGTHIAFDVALMAPLVLETRVQLPDLDTKEIFFGLTSILAINEQLEDVVINASATTVTMPADLVGFYLSDELTTVAGDWHGIHSGGTTAASTTTTSVQMNNVAKVGEWQVLRLEVASDGTTTWWIDGVLKQTVTAACSTTSNMAVCLAAAANTTQMAIFDCDYLMVEANRDWTV